ncbi:hypothetical protein EVAR_10993_1 [Eumeta japonica]|uniref:Uncharacterized protein n=1 Tax=Eumeta variegata TaxID=151549 RepID=A0A4C1YLX3_EUMVA|nr:hypothetical protein EVAR_10993_1 [Eumeta japonica]
MFLLPHMLRVLPVPTLISLQLERHLTRGGRKSGHHQPPETSIFITGRAPFFSRRGVVAVRPPRQNGAKRRQLVHIADELSPFGAFVQLKRPLFRDF